MAVHRIAPSMRNLQRQIHTVAQFTSEMGPTLNLRRCRTLHLSGSTPVGLRSTQFGVGDAEIPAHQQFPISIFLQDCLAVDDAISFHQKLLQSMLTPWQRLGALRTFLYPAFQHLMRMRDGMRICPALRWTSSATLRLSSGVSGRRRASRRAGWV